MKIYHILNGLLHVNTYVLVNSKMEAVVIDCGENYKKVKQAEKDNGFKIKAVLLTHAHFDHSGCAKKLQDDGAEIYISKIDCPKIFNGEHLGGQFGRNFESFTPDYLFSDGDELTICGITFKVIATAGHTDGSVTFVVDNMLFTGDTLFSGSVGRTEFPSGNRDELVRSIRKLFALSGDYLIYPGHDDFTTLDRERKYNIMAEYD